MIFMGNIVLKILVMLRIVVFAIKVVHVLLALNITLSVIMFVLILVLLKIVYLVYLEDGIVINVKME